MRLINLLVAIVTILAGNAAEAQQKIDEVSLYKIIYVSKHYYDTADLTKIKTDSMAVYAGKQYSVYRNAGYEDYVARVEQRTKQLMNDYREGETSAKLTLSPISSRGIVSKNEQFKKNDTNEMWMKQSLAGNTYFIPETIPLIKWDIMGETKKLDAFTCQKAVGKYKGRIYTVWFCPDLPVSTGPWSLGGLPGTILEAADSKNEVLFLFAGYEMTAANKKNDITQPAGYIEASKKEWDKLAKAYNADPLEFTKTALLGQGITINLSLPPGARRPKQIVINNPIILSDQ